MGKSRNDDTVVRKRTRTPSHKRKRNPDRNLGRNLPKEILSPTVTKHCDIRDEDGLTFFQRALCERYLAHGNIQRAIHEADTEHKFSYPYPRSLFDDEKVQAVIVRELTDRVERYKLDSETVLRKLSYILNQDVRNVYHRDGRLKQPWELDEATAASVRKIKVKEVFEWVGVDEERRRVQTGEIIEYEFWPVPDAIALAMRHLKLLDGDTTRGKDRLSEVLDAMKAGPVKAKPILEGQVSEANPVQPENHRANGGGNKKA